MLRQSIRNVNNVYTIDVSNWLSKYAGTIFMTRECECIMTGKMNKGRPTTRRSKSGLLYSLCLNVTWMNSLSLEH